MIRKLIFFLIACVCTVSLLLGLFIFLVIDEKPYVEQQTKVAPEHIERLKRTFDQHRRRILSSRQKGMATISIHPEDADIAINYLTKHFVNGSAHMYITHGKAKIRTSLPLPLQTITGFINLEATFVETDRLPQPHSVSIGHILIPDFVSQFLLDQTVWWLQNYSKYDSMISAIKHMHITTSALKVRYQWQGGFNLARSHFPVLSKSEQKKVYRYYNLLVQNNQQQAALSLSQILQPLMKMAARYSVNNPAQKENRAAILAATFYVMDLPLNYLVPKAANRPLRHSRPNITLDGRKDFAQHFIISAAITAYADTALSDAIGLYKEIEDKRSGSGFSFNDIAADRAGTRFGELATASHTDAVQLQQLVNKGINDKDLMPRWEDLPESLSKTVFRQHYGNFDTPAYHKLVDTIERRVEALPFTY
ncbi:hypothetical protein SAMN05421690_103927 [Nitrosomonas sp. Nm51]|uniref:hypothetical protein n=1 Tax=Nitrosomonas sp. Nm51 TaxID=133720 RepID=UPI0008ABDA0F|nr:hypothetical protein [Nitrosomonas sp. Nm51]SER57573.1 hypothetical protein SAMN05421690_103927 [Nitrosomonas sp. Nm51]